MGTFNLMKGGEIVNEIKARKILGPIVRKDNTLNSMSPYIRLQNEINYDEIISNNVLYLDGRFTENQINKLEAIIWWFKNMDITE